MTAIATLAQLTTTRVGGPIGEYHEVASPAEMIAAVASADARGLPLLVIGGGSNILAGDEPFPGVVIRDISSQIKPLSSSACGGAAVEVSAGCNWDELVRTAIANEWMGIEALSGIPGTVGAAPVQNIGAYGQEVAETIALVTVYDRERQRQRMLPLADLRFGYRSSILKTSQTDPRWAPSPRYIVLSVQFQFRLASLSAPIRYGELARRLDTTVGTRVNAAAVREAVLALRASKGMVLSEADSDTHSAGSFFTNPIISTAAAAALPEGAPRYPVSDHTAITNIGATPPVLPDVVKTSAAYLIENAGFAKGFTLNGRAALSTKHVLALTNRGGASAADFVELARTIRSGVEAKFGIRLTPEPVTVGLDI